MHARIQLIWHAKRNLDWGFLSWNSNFLWNRLKKTPHKDFLEEPRNRKYRIVKAPVKYENCPCQIVLKISIWNSKLPMAIQAKSSRQNHRFNRGNFQKKYLWNPKLPAANPKISVCHGQFFSFTRKKKKRLCKLGFCNFRKKKINFKNTLRSSKNKMTSLEPNI